MKKLLIMGFTLCVMGLTVPSFAASRQDQNQQDQMKKDDGMKHDMSTDSMSKDAPKN
jgi:pentapeptide MXKDX repeat protein